MSTFGSLYRVHTYGESHCKSVGAIVDGIPPVRRSLASLPSYRTNQIHFLPPKSERPCACIHVHDSIFAFSSASRPAYTVHPPAQFLTLSTFAVFSVNIITSQPHQGLELTEEDIQVQLSRRRPGQSDITTPVRLLLSFYLLSSTDDFPSSPNSYSALVSPFQLSRLIPTCSETSTTSSTSSLEPRMASRSERPSVSSSTTRISDLMTMPRRTCTLDPVTPIGRTLLSTASRRAVEVDEAVLGRPSVRSPRYFPKIQALRPKTIVSLSLTRLTSLLLLYSHA